MKIKDYIKKLQELAEKYPDASVVYSKDDEGNSFHLCQFSPSLGNFENDEWIADDGTDEFKNEYGGVNAICLN